MGAPHPSLNADRTGSRLPMPTAHHKDAILGMSVIDVPVNPEENVVARLLLSGSRDGVIKVWK